MGTALLGGVEAGGTKFVCVLGSRPDRIVAETRFPTSSPQATLGRAVAFFEDFVATGGRLRAIGVASFGPAEVRRSSARYGAILQTPKPGWSGADVLGAFRRAFDVPLGFDTDVNGAALGEWHHGAARGLRTWVYLTVGTGIGGGAVVEGALAHGLVHPEMGHMAVPREAGDDYAGGCPFHGDCLEGLASGPALAKRWGAAAEEIPPADLARAVDLEGAYLASAVRNIVYTIAPERVVIGGGVVGLPGLLPALRRRFVDSLAGYPRLREHESDGFVVAAALENRAGPVGALVLAEQAAVRSSVERSD